MIQILPWVVLREQFLGNRPAHSDHSTCGSHPILLEIATANSSVHSLVQREYSVLSPLAWTVFAQKTFYASPMVVVSLSAGFSEWK